MATLTVGRRPLEEGAVYRYTDKAGVEYAGTVVRDGDTERGVVRVSFSDGRDALIVKTFTDAAKAVGALDANGTGKFVVWGLPPVGKAAEAAAAPKAPKAPKAEAPPAPTADSAEKPKRGRKPKAQAQPVEAEAGPTQEPAESNDPIDLFE